MAREKQDREGRAERRRARRVAGEQGGAIARTLMGLKESELDQLELDEDLRWEVDQARRITSMNARRREERRVAGVLRTYDLDALAAKLGAQNDASGADARLFKLAESWRDRLIDRADALDDFLQEHPVDDPKTLHRLVREARNERQKGKPKGAGKRLFRAVREALD